MQEKDESVQEGKHHENSQLSGHHFEEVHQQRQKDRR
jgi:hypothetical protein